jgi:hypothetical protein
VREVLQQCFLRGDGRVIIELGFVSLAGCVFGYIATAAGAKQVTRLIYIATLFVCLRMFTVAVGNSLNTVVQTFLGL